MRKNDSASILHGAAILTFVNIFSQVLQFAYRVWISRLVSPEVLGLYHLIMPVYTVIMSLCVSGLTVSVARLSASYRAHNNQQAVRQLVRTALLGYSAFIFFSCAIIVPLSDAVSANILGDARTRMGLILLFPLMFLTGWENVHKNYFYGIKNIIPPAISEVVEQVSRTLAILGLVYFVQTAFEERQTALIITGMIFSEILSAILLTAFYRRSMAKQPDTGELVPDLKRQMSNIAIPVAMANVFSNIISSANSIIIPGRLIASGIEPSEALSSFGVAFSMTMPLLSFSMAFTVSIGLVMLPRLSESIALGHTANIRRKIKIALGITSAVVIPITSILIPYGQPLARHLFKNQDAGAYMVPLAIATGFVCYEYVFGSFLNAMGHQHKNASNLIVTSLLQLAITWLAVALPSLRLYGYVLAYLISNILGAVLNAFDVYKAVKKL